MPIYSGTKLTSLGNFYLVRYKGGLITIKKGTPKSELIKMIGEPDQIKLASNSKSEKLLFNLQSGGSKTTRYEFLFSDEILEWVLKIN